MTPITRFCPGCNESFATDDGKCPRCHLEPVIEPNASTSVFAETMAYQDAEQAGRGPRALDKSLIGTSLGNYKIESFLGKGGMAWVFLARHNTLHRSCAIKVLCPELFARDAGFLEQFLAEARAAAALVHPNIVTVHNIGNDGGKHFIEMEYVPGVSLQQWLERQKQLTPRRATDFLLQISSALGEAHRTGIIHRDIKPSNVMVRPNGTAKLADFGLARRVVASEQADTKMAGTPYYMAPELFDGTTASKPADVYAAGVSFFYLLTGRLPFRHRNLYRLADLHQDAPIPDPRQHCSELPMTVVDLLHACLAKHPQDRPADGQALSVQLQSVLLQIRDLDAIVAEALREIRLAWRIEGDRITVSVPTSNGRCQTVYISEAHATTDVGQVVRIFSVCGPATEDYFRRALEMNATVSHGALAIEQIDGQPYFVMVDAYPRATCDPEEIRKSVLEIGRCADQVEQVLTGRDEY